MTVRLVGMKLYFLFVAVPAVLCLSGFQGAGAQDVHLGTVWSPPADPGQAQSELEQMQAMGVTAIRTGLISDERVLYLADSLGFAIHQDMPVMYQPAGRLAEMTSLAGQALQEALERSRRFENARFFGLATLCDNSDPRFRTYVEEMVAVVERAAVPGTQTYYLAAFVEDDRAHDLVDFILLSALDGVSASGMLDRWRRTHTTIAGIGKLGATVTDDRKQGYKVPASPEWQARILEVQLNELLQPDSTPNAVFVFQFRDAGRRPALGARITHTPIGQYGLFTETGEARPAADVVSGFYTGTQRIFAFAAGEINHRERISWLVVLGWTVIALFAVMYASSPLYSQMLRRYFFAHAFYCAAVREGRELFTGTNSVLLLCQSLCAGITGTIVLDGLVQMRGAGFLARWLPLQTVEVVSVLVNQPGILILLLSGTYALTTVMWTAWFMVVSGRKRRIGAPKALLLVVWPAWPMMLLMIGALLTLSLTDQGRIWGTTVVAVSWLLIWLVSLFRAQADLARVARKSRFRTMAAGWLPVLLIISAIGHTLVTDWGPEIQFLWHLSTRS